MSHVLENGEREIFYKIIRKNAVEDPQQGSSGQRSSAGSNRIALRSTFAAATAIVLTSMLLMLPSASSHAAMYGTIHSYSGGYDWRHVRGSLDTPNPTSVADGSHKTYMVYFSSGVSPFTAGYGIYIYKNAGQPIVKCYLMLFVNDYAIDNSNYLDCSPTPSGTVSIKIEQTVNDGKSFKGTSGGNTFTYTYTQNPSTQPPNYGAAAGGTTNNLDMYSFFTNLYVKTWAGTEYTFANTPTSLYKCYVDTGYKYDNQNHNTMISGPPALTIDDCTSGIESDAFRPHQEWD